jgi:Tat protein secretion system quality control protein TatD with DNase activity
MAELRGLTPEEMARITTENALRFYGLTEQVR